MKEASKSKLIETQCKECRHFKPHTEECAFVIYANIFKAHDAIRGIEWYREHSPEDIELVEDCSMSPDKVPHNRKTQIVDTEDEAITAFNQQ